MLKNMKLSSKLILGFAIPVLAIIVIIVVSYFAVTSVNYNLKNAQSASQESFEYAMLAQKMKIDVIQVQQWFTDIAATRGLDGLDDGFSEAENSKVSFLAGFNKFHKLYTSKNDTKNLEVLNNLKLAFNEYYETGRVMATAYVKDGPQGGNKMMSGFDKAAATLFEAFNPLIQQQGLKGTSALDLVKGAVDKLNRFNIIVGLLSILLCVFCTWLLIRAVTKPIFFAVNGLTSGAEQVSGAAGQISSSSLSLAEGASEQAAALEETSASMEEMSSMTKLNAENANHADKLMKVTLGAIKTADTSMEKMSSSMVEISTASEETSRIVKTIDEIAFQTNLLALNAAVEAARAGEAGAGFAVVADEVRNLAMRAAEAAKNTSALIEGTVQKVSAGKKIVSEAIDAFKEVADNSAKVGGLVSEITSASNEQAQGFDQINTAIAQMDSVTQQNSAAAEESAAASEELNAQAEVLMDMVMGLKNIVAGGKTNNSANEAIMTTSRPKTTSSTPTPRKKALPKPTNRAVTKDPDTIIPMGEDDNEFENF